MAGKTLVYGRGIISDRQLAISMHFHHTGTVDFYFFIVSLEPVFRVWLPPPRKCRTLIDAVVKVIDNRRTRIETMGKMGLAEK